MAPGESYEVPAKIEAFQTQTTTEQGLSSASYSNGQFSDTASNYDRSHNILTSLESLVDNIEDTKPQPIYHGWRPYGRSGRKSFQRGGGSSAVPDGKSKKRARSSGPSNAAGNDEKRIRSSGTSTDVGCTAGGVTKPEGEYSGSDSDRSETFEKNQNDEDLLIDYENCTDCELCKDMVIFKSIGSKIKHLLNIHNIDKTGYCCICKKMRGNLKNKSRHFLRHHYITNVRDLPFYRILREEIQKNKKQEYMNFIKNMNMKNTNQTKKVALASYMKNTNKTKKEQNPDTNKSKKEKQNVVKLKENHFFLHRKTKDNLYVCPTCQFKTNCNDHFVTHLLDCIYVKKKNKKKCTYGGGVDSETDASDDARGKDVDLRASSNDARGEDVHHQSSSNEESDGSFHNPNSEESITPEGFQIKKKKTITRFKTLI